MESSLEEEKRESVRFPERNRCWSQTKRSLIQSKLFIRYFHINYYADEQCLIKHLSICKFRTPSSQELYDTGRNWGFLHQPKVKLGVSNCNIKAHNSMGNPRVAAPFTTNTSIFKDDP